MAGWIPEGEVIAITEFSQKFFDCDQSNFGLLEQSNPIMAICNPVVQLNTYFLVDSSVFKKP